jgi:hypothetical protein
MNSIADQMLTIYVFIDDFLTAHPALANWRGSNNHEPEFTDAEVITIGLLQGCLGVASLKQTYRLVKNNWRDAFPKLPSYSRWLARLHQVSFLLAHLWWEALRHYKMPGCLYLTDSKPIPVCKPIRHARVRLMRPEGAYFGKNSTGWFFGFKLHTLVHHSGVILAAMLTGGNCADKDADVMQEMVSWAAGGAVLADMGYRDKDLVALLEAEYGVVVLNPSQAGEKRALISSLRERIETTYSSLWHRFVDRVFSRSFPGLWSAIQLKILHFNLCQTGMLAC